GVVTLGAGWLFASLPPAIPGFEIEGTVVLVYGVMANVCYTGGWLVEMGFETLWRRKAPLVGPALFRQGLSFAVGLTLLPQL
ncbi:MAG TPA: hypothetical protein VI564_02525, partial [Candidatus Nanoarchaeia archaeon]|nr:hypothetical protein [Candidatus Nanoarchaeia archaeon]